MIDLAYWNFSALEGLRSDARTRVLSRGAFALLMRLVLEARGDGEVPYINHHDGPASVAAYDLRECDTADGGRAARAAVKELVDTGLVVLDDAARRIRLDLHEGLLSREPGAAAPRGADDVAPPGGPRRKPAWTPERQRERKARYQFAHRLGPFRSMSIPEGMTFETWSATDAGRAFLAPRPSPGTPPGGVPEHPGKPHGNTPEHPGNTPGTPPSPRTPLPEKERESKRTLSPEARAGNTPGTPHGNTPEHPGNTPRAPTVEHTGLRVEDFVGILRARSRDRVLVAAAGDSSVAVALQRALTDAAAGPLGATRRDLEALGDWYAGPGLAGRSITLGLRELASKPGQLAEHIEAARAWDRAGRPATNDRPAARAPAPAPSRAPRRVGPAPVSPREAFERDLDEPDPLVEMLR